MSTTAASRKSPAFPPSPRHRRPRGTATSASFTKSPRCNSPPRRSLWTKAPRASSAPPAILDDLTTIPWAANQVAWSVVSGPIAIISTSGLATAAVVYQNTAATVQGAAGSAAGTLGLTVLNVLPDNFGAYAGDGLPDDWQVLYFGLNNPLAGPLLDPDGDTFDNLFEYRACLVPNDPLSFLAIEIASTPGGGHSVTFSPRFPDCTYTLLGSGDLSLWEPVTGAITDAGATRTIADPQGTTARRLYRLDVQRP